MDVDGIRFLNANLSTLSGFGKTNKKREEFLRHSALSMPPLRENIFARTKETRLFGRSARKSGQDVCRRKQFPTHRQTACGQSSVSR